MWLLYYILLPLIHPCWWFHFHCGINHIVMMLWLSNNPSFWIWIILQFMLRASMAALTVWLLSVWLPYCFLQRTSLLYLSRVHLWKLLGRIMYASHYYAWCARCVEYYSLCSYVASYYVACIAELGMARYRQWLLELLLDRETDFGERHNRWMRRIGYKGGSGPGGVSERASKMKYIATQGETANQEIK